MTVRQPRPQGLKLKLRLVTQSLAHRASSSAWALKVGSAVATEPESRVAAQARSVLFTELQPDSERSRVAARSFLFAEFQLNRGSELYLFSGAASPLSPSASESPLDR